MSDWGEQAPDTWANRAAKAAETGGSLGAALGAAGRKAAPKQAAANGAAEETGPDPEDMTLDEVVAKIASLHERLATLRGELETEVLANWTSPWRGADMVATKVDARMAMHPDFKAMTIQIRELEQARGRLDPEGAHDQAAGRASSGHPAIGR